MRVGAFITLTLLAAFWLGWGLLLMLFGLHVFGLLFLLVAIYNCHCMGRIWRGDWEDFDSQRMSADYRKIVRGK